MHYYKIVLFLFFCLQCQTTIYVYIIIKNTHQKLKIRILKTRSQFWLHRLEYRILVELKFRKLHLCLHNLLRRHEHILSTVHQRLCSKDISGDRHVRESICKKLYSLLYPEILRTVSDIFHLLLLQDLQNSKFSFI